ncbi:hypothetical protein UFOVP545_13 [uncultured Caudovirales phage]|uniref:Uncharacterized protein n=1 Tax=uncultured Caudovirales phage TaxID=2100421 RepID=A0A6J5MWX4_9CAUD|nr:hypothetical protein UFOVP545_13 [uncultured Caudovirales phage]
MIPVGLLNAGGVFTVSSFVSFNMANNNIWSGMATSGSSIVAVGYSGSNGYINRSTDNGQNWTNITPSLNIVLGSVAYANGVYVVAGDYGNSTSNGQLMVSSDNGLTFTTVTISGAGSPDIRSVMWDGTKFLAVLNGGAGSNAILSSTNGTSWTQSGAIATLGSRLSKNGTIFVAITPTGSGSPSTQAICTSDPTVNTNWTTFSYPSNIADYNLAGNGIFVTGKINDVSYLTSTNGTAWTSRTLPATPTGVLGFANGFFWFKAVTTNIVYYSIDGINWTSTGAAAAQPPRTRVWFGNEITLLQTGTTLGDLGQFPGSYSI